jgi:hypothetical protein
MLTDVRAVHAIRSESRGCEPLERAIDRWFNAA